MGLFDFLKRKNLEEKDLLPQDLEPTKISPNQSAIIPFIEHFLIPPNIREMLWIADGNFKNYDLNDDRKTIFINDLFKIEFVFKKEPSLIYTTLPINVQGGVDPQQKIGYYPTYENLSPEQKLAYLMWLCDIRNPVDIGYVFIFYYGLERHLIYGKYKEAIDLILLLRRYHKNSSFYYYSAGAMIASALLHRDKDALEKVLSSIEMNQVCNNTYLLAKFMMKLPLSPKEIMSQATNVNFRNKRYILGYPEIFEENLVLLLRSEFGEPFFPFFNLLTNYKSEHRLVFANTSLNTDIRSPPFPSIIGNEEYQQAIHKILATTHEIVKQKLAQQRKTGV